MLTTRRELKNRTRKTRAAGRRELLRLESLEDRVLLTVDPGLAAGTGPAAWAPTAVTVEAQAPYIPAEHTLQVLGGYLSAPSVAEPLDIALGYIHAHAGELGLTGADVSQIDVTDSYTDRRSGTSHVYLRQMVNGLAVSNALANVNIDRFGRVVSVHSTFVGGLAQAEWYDPPVPSLTAGGAVEKAAQALGYGLKSAPIELIGGGGPARATTVLAGDFSREPIPAQLRYVAMPDGGAQLAWDLVVQTPDGDHWGELSIDARTGTMLAFHDWVEHASYNAFTFPTLENPDDGPRALIVDPEDTTASPFGWHDTDGAAGAEFTDTRGNNVSAQEDTDANNSGGFRPDGGAGLVFDFPLDLSLDPLDYQSAAITNLFYVTNVLHDVHYQYGFDEISGNFQVNNYGNGGADGDPLQADAQDGEGFNNANMATPPDGFSPRMQMFIFTLTTPRRDGDLDAGVIAHEFGHGVSNRLTGGPANSNALDAIQSGGMGEGWSDWYSLMFTQLPTDNKNDAFPVGNYVLGFPSTGPGIRRFPYSFDMSIDPLTLGDYNSSQEVHDAGEIWCSVLWDLNWVLVDRYGFNSDLYAGYTGPGTAGNLLALQLIMDAMKLQPANPSFLDARDAILMADQLLTGGENYRPIWETFARRGFGLSAEDGGANSFVVTEAFDTPVFALHVTTTDPAVGSIISTQPTDFIINLSEAYDPASVDASDLEVNGIPADSVDQTDADTLTFHFNVSPVVAEGLQTMTMEAGALDPLSDTDPLDPFFGQFRYDIVQMQVVSTVPADGSLVTLPLTSLLVNFNEVYDPASVDTGDLQLSQGMVTGFNLTDADTVEYLLAGITAEGTLTIHFDAGALTDTFGNPMAAYDGSLILDIGTVPYPVPLESKVPAGSLVYDPVATGTIATGADTDSFTISIDPGQRVTVVLNPLSSGLRGKIELIATDVGGSPVVATKTAALAGLDTVIQGYNAAALPGFPTTPRELTVRVSSVGGTTGGYELQVILNADAETESHNGAANNTRAAAQALTGFSTLYAGASRAAVLGRISGGVSPGDVFVAIRDLDNTGGAIHQYNSAGDLVGIIDSPRFDAGIISDVELGRAGDVIVALDINGDAGDGELLRFDYAGNFLGVVPLPPDPPTGPFFFFHPFGFDVAADGTYWTTQPNAGNVLHVSAAGTVLDSFVVGGTPEDVALAPGGLVYVADADGFRVVRLDTSDGSVTTFATDFLSLEVNRTAAGEILVADVFGAVLRLNSSGERTQTIFTPEPSAVQNDPSNNLWVAAFNPQHLRRFDPAGNLQLEVPLPGRGIGLAVVGTDGVTGPLRPRDTTDYYKFTLTAGQSASVLASSTNGGAVAVDLYNSAGTWLASGHSSASNIDALISDYVASAGGTFYVRVTGASGSDYNLVVTKNASFDTEPNDDTTGAQGLVATPTNGGTRVALGDLGVGAGRIFASPTDFTDSIVELDPLTGAELNRFDAPEFVSHGPDGLAFDGSSLWFINGFGSQLLWELDPDTGAVIDSDPIGFGTFDGIAALGGLIYVQNSDISDILVFDPATDTIIDVLDIDGTNPGVFAVGGIAGITGPDRIVATSNFGSSVVEIDPITGVVTSSFVPSPTTYYGLAVSGGEIYLGSPSGFIDVFSRAGAYQRTAFLPYGVSSLGGDDTGGAESDIYQISANAGATIRVETLTPGGGPGEFVNLLDPMVRILDADGNVVASNDNGATDGRNALVTYLVPGGGGGTYYVEVLASDLTDEPTTGEYVLKVGGTNSTLPAFRVRASDPPAGALLKFQPNEVILDFNDNVLLTTLQAADLTIDGMPATALRVIDGDTAAFMLPAGLAEGTHTVAIAAGALSDTQGTNIDAFSSEFTLDFTPPQVVSSSIQAFDVLPAGSLVYTVEFSEPMRTGNLDAFDIQLFGQHRGTFILPDFASYDASGTVLTVFFFSSLPDDAYTLVFVSGDGAFEDVVGNNLDGEPLAWPIPPNTSGDGVEGGNFIVPFFLDSDSQALPVPLVPVEPLGSLIYESPTAVTGTIAQPGDTDDFTIELEAGQTLTVLAESASGMELTIELLDPALATVDTATAPGPFEDAVIQTAPVDTAGIYTVRIGSATIGGLYSVRVVANAAVENESHNSTVNNDEVGSAQPLNGSFIDVGASDRGAVLGTTDSTGGFAFETEPNDSPAGAQSLDVETFALFSDATITNSTTIPHLSISGDGDGTFDYYAFTVNESGDRGIFDIDFENFDTMLFLYDAAGNLLAVSDDNGGDPGSGSGLASFIDYTFADPGAYIIGVAQYFSFDAGGQIEGTPIFPGQFYTLHVSLDGAPVAPAPPDYYSFTLDAGQTATIVLTPLVDSDLDLELRDALDGILATGTEIGTNVGEVIVFTADAAGTYYVRIGGDPGRDYSLVVTRDVGFEIETNDTFDTAQDISALGSVLGNVGAPASEEFLTFDELPPQPAHGLSVKGVNFSFTVDGSPSTAAEYGSFIGPGNSAFINTPNLIGPTSGTLTMDLDTPATEISFGAQLETLGFVDDGFVVELFDAADASLGVFPIDTFDFGFGFSENEFVYSGEAASRIVVIFNGFAAPRFVVDNLSLASPDDEDWYRVSVGLGDTISYETSTPGDEAGEFVNLLDPILELYAPDGILVATGTVLGDGRNERVEATAAVAGEYRVRIAPAGGTRGEYVLAPAAAPAFAPPSGPTRRLTGTILNPIAARTGTPDTTSSLIPSDDPAPAQGSPRKPIVVLPGDLVADVAQALINSPRTSKKLTGRTNRIGS